ncbi:MAG: hypothetical protein LBS33_03250 [Streptococcaceae bacterium]|nr:hypothetical protein [Streptococcaceae bacterium]
MKKIKKLAVTLALAGSFATVNVLSVSADIGATSPAWAKVIAEAKRLAPRHFAKHQAEIENHANTHEISAAAADKVIADGDKIAADIKATGIDTSKIDSYDDLIAVLQQVNPAIAAEVAALAEEIAELTGYAVVNPSGDGVPVSPTTNVMKNTGHTYLASGATLIALILAASGAVYVSKKQGAQA